MEASRDRAVITMRRARHADAAAIHLLLAASIQTPWSLAAVRRELDPAGASVVLLAESDAQPIGCIHWRLVLDEMEIMNLAVAPQMRRRGVGRQLLASAVRHARAAGAAAVLLEVRASNQAAIALYQTMGFQTIAIRHGYYVDDYVADGVVDGLMGDVHEGEDARCMRLQLGKT